MPITRRDIERLREQIEKESFTVRIADQPHEAAVDLKPGRELRVLEVTEGVLKVVPVRPSRE